MKHVGLPLLALAGLLAVPATTAGQLPQEMKAVDSDELEWTSPEIPGFAPGMQLAVVVGDPSVANQPYTLRLRFPPGYRFPAHYHPRAENLTVMSGTVLLAMGREENDNLTRYAPGDYLFIPAEQPHFGGAEDETVVQLHGIGPFEIKLVRPATDGQVESGTR